jgi:hypothetical protein
MIWPHQDEFPARARILTIGCVLSAVVAASMPQLSISQRLATVALVPIVLGTVYVCFRVALRIFGALSRHLAVAYAFFIFYGMLFVAAMFCIYLPQLSSEIADPFEWAYTVGLLFPTVAGACAAVVVTLRRWRDGLS